jgi:hypothetical protein
MFDLSYINNNAWQKFPISSPSITSYGDHSFEPAKVKFYYLYQNQNQSLNLVKTDNYMALSIQANEIIDYLMNNESFNIFDDRENINELVASLELDRLRVLKVFLTKLDSQIKYYRNIKKINFKVTPSDGDIDNLGLSLVFSEGNNFDQVNAFICKIYELKRGIDTDGLLWFIDIGVKF